MEEKNRIINLYGIDDEHAFVQKDPFVGNGTTKTPSNKYGSIEYNAFKPCEIMDGAAIYELKKGGAAIYELGRNAEEMKLVSVRYKNNWYKLEELK